MPRWRRALALGLILGASWGIAGNAAASSGINGGPAVASPSEAPWSVLIDARTDGPSTECSGSILDATHILTAAHCTFDEVTGRTIPPADITVTAGVDELDAGAGSSDLQKVRVASVAVDPGYEPGLYGDDVALLTLGSPLDLGPAVAAIRPVAANAAPAVGVPVALFGWGQVASGKGDRREHSLAERIVPQWQCESGVPSIICAAAAAGTACSGDSGAGLVVAGRHPTLVGVEDYSVGPLCTPGDVDVYANAASPEIARWLAGGTTAERAPRTSGSPSLWGQSIVGGVVTCRSPSWSGAPHVSLEFIDVTTNALVQKGADTYRIEPGQSGHELECMAVARDSAGETAALSGTLTVTPREAPQLALRIRASGMVDIADTARLDSRFRLVFRTPAGRVAKEITFGEGQSFVTRAPAPGHYRVCLTTPVEGIDAAASACIAWVAGPDVRWLTGRPVAHTG
jgi:Trypsin